MIETFCQKQRGIFVTFIEQRKFLHTDCDDVTDEIYAAIPSFYQEEVDEETDHLLGYMNTLLKFFHFNLDLDDEKLTEQYKHTLKEQLFEILEEEMTKVETLESRASR